MTDAVSSARLMRPDVAGYFAHYESIPGWFFAADFRLFDFLLSLDGTGDLAEIGAYKGASAILLGLHKRPDEILTICDLFGMPATDAPNRGESESWYSDLTRGAFERNYLSVLPALPNILQISSLEILDHVSPATCRFVHVDGSHLYDFVQSDIRAARAMLKPDGIVALDDWCSWDTPGVAVAVMEQLGAGELHAIATTSAKFYGSWDASFAAAMRAAVTDWVGVSPDLQVHLEPIRGEQWPRVTVPAQPITPRTLPKLAIRKLKRGLRGARAAS
jgi:methyltransferase family protein